MSWLIEAFLEEDEYLDEAREYQKGTKDNPSEYDHPGSLNMKNGYHMLKKHQDINDDKSKDHEKYSSGSDHGYGDWSSRRAYEGLTNSKGANIARKKGYIHGISNGGEVYARNNLKDKAKDKIDANIKARNILKYGGYMDPDDRAMKSVRRHEEKVAKNAAKHECADIVEIFQ